MWDSSAKYVVGGKLSHKDNGRRETIEAALTYLSQDYRNELSYFLCIRPILCLGFVTLHARSKVLLFCVQVRIVAGSKRTLTLGTNVMGKMGGC